MLNDHLEKTVKVPVRIVNGKVKYYYGGELPDISDGAIGDLIISEYKVLDKKFVEISQMEKETDIIPMNSTLMFAVSSKKVPKNKKGFIKTIITSVLTMDSYVEAQLLEPLKLQVRGSKKSNLLGVRCKIPSLDTEAISINNAYTMISEVFEPDRKSHTGNVFDKCFYKEKDNKWYPLDHLREIVESKFEANLFLDYKIFKLYESKLQKETLTNSELLLVGYLHEFKQITGKEIKALYKNKKDKYIEVVNDLIDKEIIYEVKEQVKK